MSPDLQNRFDETVAALDADDRPFFFIVMTDGGALEVRANLDVWGRTYPEQADLLREIRGTVTRIIEGKAFDDEPGI